VKTEYTFDNEIMGTLGRHIELGTLHLPKGVTQFSLFNNPSHWFNE
jgi:hypothetical protein